MFKFSNSDRLINLHYFDSQGVYLSSEQLLIEANTGLPALSTNVEPPALNDVETAVFDGQQWQVKTDLRGRIAYAKNGVRSENYRITNFDDIPTTHTLNEPREFERWVDNDWQYDIELARPLKSGTERTWRDEKLSQVLSRIDQYEKDKNYPEALRTSPIKTETDFLKLLNDRKALSDYPDTANFPFGERPTLSGVL